MHTACSSNCLLGGGGGVSASVHSGIHTPHPGLGLDTTHQCGPGGSSTLTSPPPWTLVWAWRPPGQTPQPLPQCGPGDSHPQPDPSTSPLGVGLETPPVNRIIDTRFWKYYLAPTSLRAVKSILRFFFLELWRPKPLDFLVTVLASGG